MTDVFGNLLTVIGRPRRSVSGPSAKVRQAMNPNCRSKLRFWFRRGRMTEVGLEEPLSLLKPKQVHSAKRGID